MSHSQEAINRFYSRSDEHARCPDQLQLVPLHGHDAEEAVDVVDGQVEGLVLQLVLLTHLNEPVHQNGAHVEVDLGLLAHVGELGLVLVLRGGEKKKRVIL